MGARVLGLDLRNVDDNIFVHVNEPPVLMLCTAGVVTIIISLELDIKRWLRAQVWFVSVSATTRPD